jgi:hypothetical protein
MEDKKLKVLGWIVYAISGLALIFLELYILFFSKYSFDTLMGVFKAIVKTNPALGNSLLLMLLFASIGFLVFLMCMLRIITLVFKPRTKEELKICYEKKQIRLKYPERIARLKIRELNKLVILKEIQEEIKWEMAR